ncbi:hypothetical protein [Pseudonocardia sp. NPDC049635]|uniref:hypothetical protein n=1 Tax=Pseudonocardia sp. NPDC049635 TaxID=3155506 RepID=UPI0033C59CF5
MTGLVVLCETVPMPGVVAALDPGTLPDGVTGDATLLPERGRVDGVGGSGSRGEPGRGARGLAPCWPAGVKGELHVGCEREESLVVADEQYDSTAVSHVADLL